MESDEDMSDSTELPQRNRDLGRRLKGVFAVLDGWKNAMCWLWRLLDVHITYYEGYKSRMEVTNQFNSFKEEAIHAVVNYS